MVEVVMPKNVHNNLRPSSKGWLIVVRVPEFWRPLVEAKAEEVGHTYAGWVRHLIKQQIREELTRLGRGDMDFSAGGVMVVHESARDGAEAVDMKVGPSDDPIENLARNFLDIPGKD